MLSNYDLTFYPYLNGIGHWHRMPETEQTPEIWLWMPALPVTVDGDLDTITALRTAGWERVERPDNQRRLHMRGQLADMVAMRIPGRRVTELWARTEDMQRLAATPAALAFARPTDLDAAPEQSFLPNSKRTTLQVAQALPPPQFGEYGLIMPDDTAQSDWQVYPLSALGDEGLDIWRRLGEAIKSLAAPGEWWPHTQPLQVCLRGQYRAFREDLRSQLLATSGAAREMWRERITLLEIDERHAKALRKARGRAENNPDDWLSHWQEIRDIAHTLSALYWQAHIAIKEEQANLARVIVDELPPATPERDAEATLDDETPLDTATADPAAAQELRPPQDPEGVAVLARLTDAGVVDGVAPTLDTPSYQEERAAREAILSDKLTWPTESGMYRYRASNSYAVYFGDPDHPLKLEEAQAQLLRIREGTLLTVRIAEGIWNLRRHDPNYMRNGMVGITYDEILRWRGVKKHHRQAHPGTGSTQQRTDGYRTEDREDVRRDFSLAHQLYLRGQHPVKIKGKERVLNVDARYIRTAFISTPTLWGTEEQLGLWFAPGDWITGYEDEGNVYLAEIDQRVFQLNPQNEQHELKLALFLTEQWRYQARRGNYDREMTMADLLQHSVIAVDHNMLTNRFAPRIEQTLVTLQQRGIIGAYECLDPVNKTKGRWGKAWLAARWRITPPESLKQSYLAKGITQKRLPPSQHQ